MPCWGESAEVEHEYVEEAAEHVTLEEDKKQKQQDQDAHVCYGLHGGGCRGHTAFWTNTVYLCLIVQSCIALTFNPISRAKANIYCELCVVHVST